MSRPEEDWTAAQFADELIRLQAVLDSLEAARRAGVPDECITTLAAECGVSKEMQWKS